MFRVCIFDIRQALQNDVRFNTAIKVSAFLQITTFLGLTFTC